jgi:hypothetical protein
LVNRAKVTGDRKHEYLHKLPGVQAMPYGAIDTWGTYSIIDTPMFTSAIPLTLYITFRQIVGEVDIYN